MVKAHRKLENKKIFLERSFINQSQCDVVGRVTFISKDRELHTLHLGSTSRVGPGKVWHGRSSSHTFYASLLGKRTLDSSRWL